MSKCSVPRLLGLSEWFNSRFADLCDAHDHMYVQRVWKLKVASDFELCAQMAARGYTALAFAAFVYVSTVGALYWAWKKYRQKI